jgi:hypothetical protein
MIQSISHSRALWRAAPEISESRAPWGQGNPAKPLTTGRAAVQTASIRLSRIREGRGFIELARRAPPAADPTKDPGPDRRRAPRRRCSRTSR